MFTGMNAVHADIRERLQITIINSGWKGKQIRMADKAWKQAERDIASLFGSKRNPNNGENREDISHARLSIEVKHGKQVPKLIVDAMGQAKRNAPAGKVPVVALHPKGSRSRYTCITVSDLAILSPDLFLCMEVGELARIIADLEGGIS